MLAYDKALRPVFILTYCGYIFPYCSMMYIPVRLGSWQYYLYPDSINYVRSQTRTVLCLFVDIVHLAFTIGLHVYTCCHQ